MKVLGGCWGMQGSLCSKPWSKEKKDETSERRRNASSPLPLPSRTSRHRLVVQGCAFLLGLTQSEIYNAFSLCAFFVIAFGVANAMVGCSPHIQPLGGGLRAIVPAPSGILAVGDGAVGDLVSSDRAGDSRPELVVPGVDGEVGELTEAGDTGFILKPLMAGRTGGGGWVGGGGPGATERGVGGRIFSLSFCRYAADERTGNAGVLPGLGLAGDTTGLGGSGKLMELSVSPFRISEDVVFLVGD